MWRWQLKTCWDCYCCWCLWWETAYYLFSCFVEVSMLKFRRDFEACWQPHSVFVLATSQRICVGNIILQILELRFGHKAKLLFRLWIWAQDLVKILKLKFRQDSEAGVCSSFCRWCFVEVMKLYLGRDSEARFGQGFEVKVLWRCWCLVEILNLALVGHSED